MKSQNTVWHVLRNALAMAPTAAMLAIALLSGCSSLLPPPLPPDSIYILEAGTAPKPTSEEAHSTLTRRDLVLEVSMPRARAGFDTAQMVWVRQKHGLEIYAHNRWADTPAHMLASLLVQALERSKMFHSVVQTPSMVPAMLRLDTELIRLQQDFSVRPSRVQITLSAQLIDIGTRRVIAKAEFDETENAMTEDAYGGVRAANQALERVLAKLTAFCTEHESPP